MSWSLSEDDLSNIFAPYGEVISAKIVTDRFNNNRSRGFGFVEMSDGDGRSAIDALNGMDVGGRTLVVNESQPRERSQDSGGSGNGFRRNSNSSNAGGNRGGGNYERNNRFSRGGGGYSENERYR